jgi:hypothetical protein
VHQSGEIRGCGGNRERRGRWLDDGFPKIGWRFAGIEDYGEEGRVCQMCGHAKLRFLHLMTNDPIPEVLALGLQCAELLEQDWYRPAKRERRYQDDLRVMKDWPGKRWKLSSRGNPYVNVREFNITIWDKGGAGFGVTIKLQNKFDGSFEINGKKLYRTLEEAKAGALDAFIYARNKFASLE